MWQTTGGKEWQLGRPLLLWDGSAGLLLFLAAGPLSAPLCMKNRRSAASALQNDFQHANPVHVSLSVGDRCHEGGAMMWHLSSLCCAACLAFAKRHKTLAFRWGQHMWQTRGSLEMLCSCLHILRYDQFDNGLERHEPLLLPVVSCCLDETLRTIIKPYAGEHQFILAHSNAWTDAAGKLMVSTDPSVPMNPIKGLRGIMYCYIQHLVKPQAFHKLTDAQTRVCERSPGNHQSSRRERAQTLEEQIQAQGGRAHNWAPSGDVWGKFTETASSGDFTFPLKWAVSHSAWCLWYGGLKAFPDDKFNSSWTGQW